LQRFEGGFYATAASAKKSTSSKLHTRIDFPLQLDMSPYTTRSLSSASTKAPQLTSKKENSFVNGDILSSNGTSEVKELCTFDLQTVVVHIGGLNGGHYVAYCRSGKEVSSTDRRQRALRLKFNSGTVAQI
jgi:ubiquitin carboxyl-terminal hydrolase 22/27/51